MTRMIIDVEGGLVQAVWSTDKSIEVEIMNRDLPESDEDAEDCLREIARLEAEIKELNMSDIS